MSGAERSTSFPGTPRWPSWSPVCAGIPSRCSRTTRPTPRSSTTENAAVLAGSQRPDDIIREAPAALDGRSQRFESPHENLEILCRYHVVLAEGRWQLLTVRKDRCGAVRPTATIAARFGTPVPVPASSTDVVVARLSGVGSSLGDTVRAALLRGPAFYVSGDRGESWNRFLPGTQQFWHIVSWPACAAPDLFNLGPPFRTLTMSNHRGRRRPPRLRSAVRDDPLRLLVVPRDRVGASDPARTARRDGLSGPQSPRQGSGTWNTPPGVIPTFTARRCDAWHCLRAAARPRSPLGTARAPVVGPVREGNDDDELQDENAVRIRRALPDSCAAHQDQHGSDYE